MSQSKDFKIFIAPDSFKESMSSREAGLRMESAAKRIFPGILTDRITMSDGGEGFLNSMTEDLEGQKIPLHAKDSLLRTCQTEFVFVPEQKLAILEMARIAGLECIEPNKRNPWITSSYGVGELIKRALDLSCRKIILGIGGSATNDAGAGMAQALGLILCDRFGKAIGPGGGSLGELSVIDETSLDPRLKDVEIIIASDVSNPLCGKHGASLIFGPQKGATNTMALQLDHHLNHFNTLLNRKCNLNAGEIPGSGAAGGLALPLLVFGNTKIVSGFELIRKYKKIDERLHSCNLVITGEGKTDSQSISGKAAASIGKLARSVSIPAVAFTGIAEPGFMIKYPEIFNQLIEIRLHQRSLAESIRKGPELLERACEVFFKDMKAGKLEYL